jgi:hypothetical protein
MTCNLLTYRPLVINSVPRAGVDVLKFILTIKNSKIAPFFAPLYFYFNKNGLDSISKPFYKKPGGELGNNFRCFVPCKSVPYIYLIVKVTE